MKKHYTLTVLFLHVILGLYACSFISISFCSTAAYKAEELVVSGVILGEDSTGIDFQILEIFRGEESKSVIRIWDGTDFDCNGLFSMAAEDLGAPGDTLILILPRIDSMENTWDVIGDYRRPDYTSFTAELEVENGIVHGFIKGPPGAPPQFILLSVPYSEFQASWNTYGDCTNLIVSIAEVREPAPVSYVNPVHHVLELNFKGVSARRTIEIYSGVGGLVKQVESRSDIVSIDLSSCAGGLYLVRIVADDRKQQVIRVIKR